MINLRPYQSRLIDDIRQAWASGQRNVLGVMPTGAGKTVTFSALNSDGAASCTIVHRQELVGQISKTYAVTGIKHNIIAPQPVINFCIAQHVKAVGRSFYDPRASVHVSGVDTLIRRHEPGDRWSRGIQRWTTDECFVSGTLVDGRPIENIRVGDFVTAFDEMTGDLVRRPVTRTFKNSAPSEIVKVVSTHHVLYTTKGHPFWTKRGWVLAKDLRQSDTILTDPVHMVRSHGQQDERGAAVSLAKDRSDILQQVVRTFTPRREPQTEDRAENQPHTMLYMREGGSISVASSDADGTGILFDRLRQHLQVQGVICDDDQDQQKTCVKSHEGQQPDASGRVSEEDAIDLESDRAQAASTRREWKTPDKGRNRFALSAEISRVRDATCGADGVPERDRARTLQDRLRASGLDDSDRSGRTESFVTRKASVGCAQGQVLEWARVESVSVLKRNDPDIPGDGHVYNIEVDGFHTYIANGVVVHNCHHVRADNKWGKACDLFPHAFGLGVTATPIRADNKSLHHEQGGVFHTLVQGPDMRWLIDQGNLCDYRVIAAKSSIDEAMLKVGSTGDFTAASTKKARKAELVGDVVETYLERVAGKQAIVFAVDVQDAHDIAGRFNDRGVRSAALDATSSDTDRAKQVEDFAAGRIQVLTNVDLFGEGFDVPACEVVIMARPTMSFGLFVQQFGRALRTIEGKQFGIIIDHVGNVTRMAAIHGMPDTPRRWELWRDENQRGTQRNPDAIPMRTCAGCGLAYAALQMICPFCGTVHEPAGRGAPQQVDGILAEMSPELLAQLRAARAQVETDRPMIPTGADAIVARAIENRHRDRQAAHRSLAEVMQVWGGIRQVEGDSDDQMQARFYHRFGVDVYTAQTLKAADAIKLRDAIRETLT